MEEHFLAGMIEGEPTFRPEPWYNPVGDCLVYKMANEASVADRVDDLLTIYRSAEDNRPIGFQIKGIAAMIRKLGLAGLAVASQADDASVTDVSIAALLLAAYEEGAATMDRRSGYAAAMEFDVPREKRRISRDELQPA
ncbi:MAG: hypothetical protein NTW96_06550 [Planctomycetia bacterium]|jgi:hypothetical protein|nr:hypothetical protein [Planctomycetia bacterium]